MTYRTVKRIKERRKQGVMPSTTEWVGVLSKWLKLYGMGGCDCYPYTTFWDMVNDLLFYYEGK
jgi:hypothetical protein